MGGCLEFFFVVCFRMIFSIEYSTGGYQNEKTAFKNRKGLTFLKNRKLMEHIRNNWGYSIK